MFFIINKLIFVKKMLQFNKINLGEIYILNYTKIKLKSNRTLYLISFKKYLKFEIILYL